MRIVCPCCGEQPPVQRWLDEDYEAYGHRKWRWLANHIVSAHSRAIALTFQHREAVKEGRAKLNEVKFPGKRTHAA